MSDNNLVADLAALQAENREMRQALQIVVDSFAASRRASIDIGVGVTYSEKQWQMREPLYMKAVRAALQSKNENQA